MFDNVDSITILEKQGRILAEKEVLIDDPVKVLKSYPNGKYRIKIDYKPNADLKTRRIKIELKNGQILQLRKNPVKVEEVEIIQNPRKELTTTNINDDLVKQIIDVIVDALTPMLQSIEKLSEETKRATLGLITDYKKNPVDDFMGMLDAFEKFQEVLQPEYDEYDDDENDNRETLNGGNILTSILSNPAIINAFTSAIGRKPEKKRQMDGYDENEMARMQNRLSRLERENDELSKLVGKNE